MPRPHLKFLDFEPSEDHDGLLCWSALASPLPAHGPALLAEVQALLDDLTETLGAAGPVDEGYAWDMALDVCTEQDRTTVSLHLTGRERLAQGLQPWTQT